MAAILVAGGLVAVWTLAPAPGVAVDRQASARDASTGDSTAGSDAGVSAPRAGSTVEVTAISGRVERQQPGRAWRPARVGDHLTEQEAVRTADDASARLNVGPRANLEIASSSELSVREITEATHRFRLKEGRLSVDYSRNGDRLLQIEGRGGRAEVRAQAGRFAVLGTERTLAVATEQGEVQIAAAGKTVQVPPGEQSTAVEGGAPSDPLPIPKEVLLSIAGVGRPIRVTRPEVTVTGRTQAGNRIIVGGRPVTPDPRGRFLAEVALGPGQTRLQVVAESPAGRRASGELQYVLATQSSRSDEGLARPGPRRGKIKDIDIRWGR